MRFIFTMLMLFFVLRVVNMFRHAVKAHNQSAERMQATPEPPKKSWSATDVVDAEYVELPDDKRR
jgi:hypothetical protein